MSKTVFSKIRVVIFMSVFVFSLDAADSGAVTNTQEVAKQLQNPVASLISVPFQNNFEYGLGPGDKGSRYTLRFQPVIPTSISEDWNLVFRPILPFISQHNAIGYTSQTGLSDMQLEVFFSPKSPTSSGIIWGIGPILLLPTATNIMLGYQKWGIGPTGVVLTQKGAWTMGMLANHLISYAGSSDRKSVSATYMQPFIARSNKKGFTVSFLSETSYDWKGGHWTVPFIGGVSQILPVYGQLISAGVSGIYYAKSPVDGPKWGIRAVITLLFPSKEK